MDHNQEIFKKMEKIRVLLDSRAKKSVLIGEQPNFSWITGGSRGFLGLASTKACGSILITKQDAYLIANNIEGKRLMQEEGIGSFCELLETPWQKDGNLLPMITARIREIPLTDTELKGEFASLRQVMIQEEQDRYRSLCHDSALAMEGAMKAFTPGITEFDAAGRIASALWRKGIEPISLFVAADDRVQQCRHFIPTAKTANHQLIASICGRKYGLVASVTRTIAFGTPGEKLVNHYQKLIKIESAGWDALKSGKPMSEIYQAICKAYTGNGLDGEWDNHHQGGLTGYLPREIRIDSSTRTMVMENQAFAFNPSCRWAKVEDTILYTASGVELLSSPAVWPTINIEGYLHPDILKIPG